MADEQQREPDDGDNLSEADAGAAASGHHTRHMDGESIPDNDIQSSGPVVDEANRNQGNIPHQNVPSSCASGSEPPAESSNRTANPTFKMPVFGPRPGLKKKDSSAEKAFEDNAPDLEERANLGSVSKSRKSSEKEKTESDKFAGLSPAERLKQSEVPIPYKEPTWGGVSEKPYSFEVLKNGSIVDTVDLSTKSFHVFGRLPSCDVMMEHPSLSRYHAIIQHCAITNEKHEIGWYLYDLDSTHGTWLNKLKVKPHVYTRLRVGHMLKFGGSTRLYILQGPDNDQDAESELSVTEMKAQREQQKKEAELIKEAQEEDMENTRQKQPESDPGCTWGMMDDAEDIDGENPFAVADEAENEELYLQDPKKTLRGYFEREGYDLPEYDCSEVGRGEHRCRVEVPVDSIGTEPMVAEAIITGKKKEAVVACALEACRMLDRLGLLRTATHESRKKKKKNWEEDDFYDSDDDTYLDRTGTIEKKREQRMKKAGKKQDEAAYTYETLVEKLTGVAGEIKSIEEQLEKAKADAKVAEEEEDALDAYMLSIKSGAMDTKTKMKLKRQLLELRMEEQRLRKLANIAKPASMPALKSPSLSKTASSGKQFPLFGKMKGPSKQTRKPVGPVRAPPVQVISTKEVEEEEEEEENSSSNTAGTSKAGEVAIETQDKPKPASETEENKSPKTEEAPIEKDAKEANIMAEQTVQEKMTSQQVQPPKQATETASDETSLQFISPQNKRLAKLKFKGPTRPPKETKLSKDYCDTDPDYAMWVPPTGQSGDGKTHLNEKYGY